MAGEERKKGLRRNGRSGETPAAFVAIDVIEEWPSASMAAAIMARRMARKSA